ncbi:MBL fold metallo-hydrolase [Haloparvum sp. AD34]
MKIHTVSGYESVGANMTAVEVDGEVVICDVGADVERVVEADAPFETLSTETAIASGLVPDDGDLFARREDVVAIVVGHAHLDHCLGVAKLAGAYDCPIYATPYTARVLDRLIEEDVEAAHNDVRELELGGRTRLSPHVDLEFVNVTHSIPGAALTVLHTPDGAVAYSLDFKLDPAPTLGRPTDESRLREIADEGIAAYVADCTRVDEPGRTGSEREAATQLRNVLDTAYRENRAVVLSTFSSHIARLANVLDANDGRRRVAFLGWSLRQYTDPARDLGLVDLSNVEVHGEKGDVAARLREADPAEWLFVVTGHQGEPNAVLTELADRTLPLALDERDRVILASSTIPTPINRASRDALERALRDRGVRVDGGVHVHGHALRQDHRDMLALLDATHVLPAHAGAEKQGTLAALARERGYVVGETVHPSQNGRVVDLDS